MCCTTEKELLEYPKSASGYQKRQAPTKFHWICMDGDFHPTIRTLPAEALKLKIKSQKPMLKRKILYAPRDRQELLSICLFRRTKLSRLEFHFVATSD